MGNEIPRKLSEQEINATYRADYGPETGGVVSVYADRAPMDPNDVGRLLNAATARLRYLEQRELAARVLLDRSDDCVRSIKAYTLSEAIHAFLAEGGE